MKTVGIIGGLGPQASVKFCLEIISSCSKKNKNQRPPILIWNVPIPIKIEKELIIKDIGEEKFLPFLIDAAKTLEKAGADFLVMPCNTMHIFIEDIRRVVNIPVLSIVDETISIIKKQKISKVGVLATSITINKDLFANKLKRNGIKQVTLESRKQSKLNKIIHNLVLGTQTIEDKAEINKIITQMLKQEVKNIILACTDLQLLIEKKTGVEILDTMQILANAAVKELLKGGDHYD